MLHWERRSEEGGGAEGRSCGIRSPGSVLQTAYPSQNAINAASRRAIGSICLSNRLKSPPGSDIDLLSLDLGTPYSNPFKESRHSEFLVFKFAHKAS